MLSSEAASGERISPAAVPNRAARLPEGRQSRFLNLDEIGRLGAAMRGRSGGFRESHRPRRHPVSAIRPGCAATRRWRCHGNGLTPAGAGAPVHLRQARRRHGPFAAAWLRRIHRRNGVFRADDRRAPRAFGAWRHGALCARPQSHATRRGRSSVAAHRGGARRRDRR